MRLCVSPVVRTKAPWRCDAKWGARRGSPAARGARGGVGTGHARPPAGAPDSAAPYGACISRGYREASRESIYHKYVCSVTTQHFIITHTSAMGRAVPKLSTIHTRVGSAGPTCPQRRHTSSCCVTCMWVLSPCRAARHTCSGSARLTWQVPTPNTINMRI